MCNMQQSLYSHKPADYRCPFCPLAHGVENPDDHSRLSDIVYQDESVTALVASHQYLQNTPNIIVIPNEHYENIFDLPPELGAAIYGAAQKVAFALKRVYGCDGISTRQHNETAGSQDVWHYHLHVTPRYKDDWFYKDIYNKRLMGVEERAAHAERLKEMIEHGL